MILSELVDLVQTAGKLVSAKADLDRKYFDDFIKPIWEKFVEIHEDYKKTFQEYTRLANENSGDISSFIDQIRKDSIYSQDLRVDLESMVSNLPPAFPKVRKQLLEDFLSALSMYFYIRWQSFISKKDSDEIIMQRPGPAFYNMVRFSIIIFLSRKGIISSGRDDDVEDKDDVIKFLQDIMWLLQLRYQEASKAYYDLKKELLT